MWLYDDCMYYVCCNFYLNQGFYKNFCSAPNCLKSYMPTAPQSTMMGQSYSISIEGLNHVVPKWSNRSSKVGHLVFSLGQWSPIVAYQMPWFEYWKCKTKDFLNYVAIYVAQQLDSLHLRKIKITNAVTNNSTKTLINTHHWSWWISILLTVLFS